MGEGFSANCPGNRAVLAQLLGMFAVDFHSSTQNVSWPSQGFLHFYFENEDLHCQV
jgi:hypothetical protein